MMDMNESLLTCLTWIWITAFIFVAQVEFFFICFLFFYFSYIHLDLQWESSSAESINLAKGYEVIATSDIPGMVRSELVIDVHRPRSLPFSGRYQSNKWSFFQKSSIFAAPKRKRLEGISIGSTNEVPLAADTGKDPIISIKLWLEAKVKMGMLLFHSLVGRKWLQIIWPVPQLVHRIV